MNRSRRSGSVLIITLGILAGIVAILATVAASQHVATRARLNRTDKERAQLVAESGIQHAMAVLSTLPTPTVTTQQDEWTTLGGTFTQPGTIRYTENDGTYRVQIVDGSGLIDINTATQAQLQKLPLTQEQVDSLLDWRETGKNPRADGAKDAYYNALQNPYNTKLGRFDTLDELLLVKNFTAATLYDVQTQTVSTTPLVANGNGQQPTLASICTVESYSAGVAAGGPPKVNVSNRNFTAAQIQRFGFTPQMATAILAGAPYTTFGALLRLPGVTIQTGTLMLNNLYVSAAARFEGKVDLNTAPEAVLNSMPAMRPDITSAIITRQSSGFNTLADLLTVPGVTIPTAAGLIDDVSVSTQTYLIRVVGSVGSASVALEATVNLANKVPTITKITTAPFADMPNRWGWYDAATDTTVLDPGQVTK